MRRENTSYWVHAVWPAYGSCYLREPDARFMKNYIGEYTILTDAHICAQKTRPSFPETWESRTKGQSWMKRMR